jgi:hypothetical protein
MLDMSKAKTILSLFVTCCLLVATITAAGCNGDGGVEEAALPTVTPTNPTDGATEVDIRTTVEATFSEAMQASTITASTFTLIALGETVAGDVAYSRSSRAVTFTPSTNLKCSTTYTATIAAEVQTSEGDNLASDFRWSFTTVSPPVISDISVTDISANRATINWETDESATGQVEYGETDGYKSTSRWSTEFTTSHSVTLTSLSPETTYHYMVRAKDEAGNVSSSGDRELTTTGQFTLSNLVINPTEVQQYEEVTATAEVKNNGEDECDYIARLRVDKWQLETKEITVDGGETETVAFTFVIDRNVASCSIDINGLSGTLAVKEPNFSIGDLVINPTEAQVYENVTATAQVENTGEGTGTYTAVLKVNGSQVQTKKFVVRAESTETIDFSFMVDRVMSDCPIEINGLNATLTVKEWEGVPTHNVGDTWTYRVMLYDTAYTMIAEVTGEDVMDRRECYVVEASFDAPLEGFEVNSAVAKIDKATRLPVIMTGEGDYDYMGMRIPGIMTAEFSYEFPNGLPYPLEKGKEFTVVVTTTVTVAIDFTALYSEDSSTATYTYGFVVEDIENRQVGAGIFEDCFKIVTYDETDAIASTMWVSDDIGQLFVELIFADMGDTFGMSLEIVSYSPGP